MDCRCEHGLDEVSVEPRGQATPHAGTPVVAPAAVFSFEASIVASVSGVAMDSGPAVTARREASKQVGLSLARSPGQSGSGELGLQPVVLALGDVRGPLPATEYLPLARR